MRATIPVLPVLGGDIIRFNNDTIFTRIFHMIYCRSTIEAVGGINLLELLDLFSFSDLILVTYYFFRNFSTNTTLI